VDLAVFDVHGRRVRALVDGAALAAAEHRIDWDGRDDTGVRLGAGVYWYRLVTPEGRFDRRLVLVD
jgi:flagellar hook assembly protein FlgD